MVFFSFLEEGRNELTKILLQNITSPAVVDSDGEEPQLVSVSKKQEKVNNDFNFI